jgi:hypothetical protein
MIASHSEVESTSRTAIVPARQGDDSLRFDFGVRGLVRPRGSSSEREGGAPDQMGSSAFWWSVYPLFCVASVDLENERVGRVSCDVLRCLPFQVAVSSSRCKRTRVSVGVSVLHCMYGYQ